MVRIGEDEKSINKFIKMEKLELNYQEYSFIMDIPLKQAKDLFLTILEQEKVKVTDLILASDLMKYTDATRSNDPRYDGKNKLLFYLDKKSENYKKYLHVKSFIKKKKFTGGKSIFYKICSPEQLEHAKQSFQASWDFLYKKKSDVF